MFPKLTRGMVISCPNGHACGHVIHERVDDAPILRTHLAIDAVAAPSNEDALLCPRCRENVARVITGCYVVHIKGRGWVS